MPKRARQAHIPLQVRRRKPRRPNIAAEGTLAPTPMMPDETTENEPAMARTPMPAAATPVPAARGRRLEMLSGTRESVGLRVVPGQLPTFERGYLVSELRRILITAGSLLALIIFLSFVLR